MLGESEIEIRPIFTADDFGEALTPELREQEERLVRRDKLKVRECISITQNQVLTLEPYLSRMLINLLSGATTGSQSCDLRSCSCLLCLQSIIRLHSFR